MEERIREKVDKVVEEIEAKELALCEQYKKFKESFFTKEVCDMINVIVDYRTHQGWIESGDACTYCIANISETKFKFRWKEVKIDDTLLSPHDSKTIKHDDHIKRKSYDDRSLDSIKYHAENYLKERELLELWTDNAAEILNCITSQYNVITNKQINTLNSVMEMLSVEEKPLQKIKITVEYI